MVFFIKSLKIECLRNIKWLELDLDAPVIVISGANGAGKTTILEAIYLLARGRTFRGRKAGSLTTLGEVRTRLLALVESSDGTSLSVRYTKDLTGSRQQTYLNDRIQTSEFTLPFQVKLIAENSQLLLEGEPRIRRRFFDWNLFQVEPNYPKVYAEFERILAQRNNALRSGSSQRICWDIIFIEAAERLEGYRRAFFDEWRSRFLDLCADYQFLADYDFIYQRGWPSNQTLSEALCVVREQEMARGYTLIGPSRMNFVLETRKARLGFSRGQAKVAVALLQLSAELVLRAHDRAHSIWLLDDIETEIDASISNQLCEAFCATGSQIIASRVSSISRPATFFSATSHKMFHVERGAILLS